MKFNEKIIKLRREKGLSQEQLGYELGVTRQTVSKWELGITTPEMDKLVEISKLFNISLDELLKEENNSQESDNGKDVNQLTYNNYTKNQKTRNLLLIKILIIVVITAIVIGLIYLIISGITKYNNEKKDREYKEKIQEKVVDQMDNNNYKDVYENAKDIINNYRENSDKEKNNFINENDENQNQSNNKENNNIQNSNKQNNLNETDNKDYYQEVTKEQKEIIDKAIDIITKDDKQMDDQMNEIQNKINEMIIR